MVNVPSYEEFEALKKQVEQLRREVAYLIGTGGKWMSRKQAMQALNCSSATLYRLMKAGKIEHRFENTKPLFNADSVRAYIESTRVSPRLTDERLLAAIAMKGQN